MGMGAMGGGMSAGMSTPGAMGMGMPSLPSQMGAPRPPATPPGALTGPGAQQTTAPGWQATIDPASGVLYYQNMTTGERSWTDPMWSK
eukprot:scaffold129304_cov43-Prasinocladus_malaysianus.AAC.1